MTVISKRNPELELIVGGQELCVKVEVAVLASPSPYGLCGRKATLNLNFRVSGSRHKVPSQKWPDGIGEDTQTPSTGLRHPSFSVRESDARSVGDTLTLLASLSGNLPPNSAIIASYATDGAHPYLRAPVYWNCLYKSHTIAAHSHHHSSGAVWESRWPS